MAYVYISEGKGKVIIDGDKKIADGKIKKCEIGKEIISFNKSFNDEKINIGSNWLNDYSTKIGNIKEAYELLKLKINNIDNNDIYSLSGIVLETVDEYFGGITNVNSRMNYYIGDGEPGCENNLISNLKGTGAAMCAERAALAQNLLVSLGINSFYKTSRIIKNNTREEHAYNLIEYNEKYYIFDAAIPNLINEKANPLIAEITKESFDLISVPVKSIGISITVSHYNPYRDCDITITYDSGRKNHIEVNSLTTIKNRKI